MNIFVTLARKDDLCTATRILKDFYLQKYLTIAEAFSVCGQIKSDWQYANS